MHPHVHCVLQVGISHPVPMWRWLCRLRNGFLLCPNPAAQAPLEDGGPRRAPGHAGQRQPLQDLVVGLPGKTVPEQQETHTLREMGRARGPHLRGTRTASARPLCFALLCFAQTNAPESAPLPPPTPPAQVDLLDRGLAPAARGTRQGHGRGRAGQLRALGYELPDREQDGVPCRHQRHGRVLSRARAGRGATHAPRHRLALRGRTRALARAVVPGERRGAVARVHRAPGRPGPRGHGADVPHRPAARRATAAVERGVHGAPPDGGPGLLVVPRQAGRRGAQRAAAPVQPGVLGLQLAQAMGLEPQPARHALVHARGLPRRRRAGLRRQRLARRGPSARRHPWPDTAATNGSPPCTDPAPSPLRPCASASSRSPCLPVSPSRRFFQRHLVRRVGRSDTARCACARRRRPRTWRSTRRRARR